MNIKSILDGIKCFIENPKSYELLYSKNDEIHNEYALSEKEGKLLLEYITKLQNNWNELKKWLEEQKEFINDIPTFSNDIKNNHIGMVGAYNNSLDKMQELDGNNE